MSSALYRRLVVVRSLSDYLIARYGTEAVYSFKDFCEENQWEQMVGAYCAQVPNVVTDSNDGAVYLLIPRSSDADVGGSILTFYFDTALTLNEILLEARSRALTSKSIEHQVKDL